MKPPKQSKPAAIVSLLYLLMLAFDGWFIISHTGMELLIGGLAWFMILSAWYITLKVLSK